jgi:hypothetical protein
MPLAAALALMIKAARPRFRADIPHTFTRQDFPSRDALTIDIMTVIQATWLCLPH